MSSLVSVCITTYNRKSLLPIALSSILNQTYRNIEIIIVDDCSSDGTQKVIKEELLIIDKRIRYIRHDKNKGLAAARNTALSNAKGKYFSFCDDDDQWLPNFVEEFVKVAEDYNSKWCFCCGQIIEKKKLKIQRIYKEENLTLKEAIIKGYVPPGAAQFYYTDTLKRIGGYNEKIKSGIDHDLWLSLSYDGISIVFLSTSLAKLSDTDDHERITNNFYKRNFFINQSLLLWKKKFILMYGKEKYKIFSTRYKYIIFKSFFLKSLKKKETINAIKFLFFSNNFFFTPLLLSDAITYLFKNKKNRIIIQPILKISNKSLFFKILNFFL